MTAPCRTRKAFILHVDLDLVPGTFNTPLSAYENVQGMLNQTLSDYNPVAIFAVTHPAEKQKNGRKRVAFVVNVDLNDVPGMMYTQESAQNILTHLFRNRIPHYNPMISLAPADIQPSSILKGNVSA